MRLIELHPIWVGAGGPDIRNADGSPVPERYGVGVSFDCPDGCGEHCFIPFENPLDGGPPIYPERVRWQRTGESFETLTLMPSILRMGGCRWHGFITNGEIRTA